MSKMILGYWDIHGLALPIRFLLQVAGAEYDEKLYQLDNVDEWFNEKKNMGLLFPNLPYLIDGENKLTEHMAIMRYIGRKYKLAPENDREAMLVDQVESFVVDLRTRLSRACYDTVNYEKSKKEYLDFVSDKLDGLEKLFGHHTYVVGKRMTYMDIYLQYFLLFLNTFDDQILKSKPNLMKFLNHMNELPAIKAYKSSSKWKASTFCGPMASFKGTY